MSSSDPATRAPRLRTLCLHAGQEQPDPASGARAVPIYQTTSFVFEDSAQAAALFDLERQGFVYSRTGNPTLAAFEQRMAALEGGIGALATASGQSALFTAIMALTQAGSHLVSSASLYGGSVTLLRHMLPRFGIETTLVDPRQPEAFRAAIRPETRLVLGEVISNPGLEVMDIRAVADIAHEAGVPLLVDATFATPFLCRPFELGADIVLHSATKWLGGHGVAIGGVLVDGGRFDWAAEKGRFPTLSEPYAGYKNIVFCEHFGAAAFLQRARNDGLREIGCCMSPTTAFHLLQGLETLPLRMKQHVANARAVATFLAHHHAVRWVRHPDRPDHPDYAVAQRQFPNGSGGMVAFGVKGGAEAACRFIDATKMISHLVNIGDAKSLAVHPATTTHRQLTPEAMAAGRVTEDMIRLSVGLEDAADIIDDLDQALDVAMGKA